MVVHAMTLEVLNAFGTDIVEQLVNRGRKIEQSNTINRRKVVAIAKLRTRDDTIYDYALILPQSDTEDVLRFVYEVKLEFSLIQLLLARRLNVWVVLFIGILK